MLCPYSLSKSVHFSLYLQQLNLNHIQNNVWKMLLEFLINLYLETPSLTPHIFFASSNVFSYVLSGKRNCWFDTAGNKFTLIRKWIWITLAENCTTTRGKYLSHLYHANKNDLLCVVMRAKRLYRIKTFYRRIYFDAINTVINCIKTRFSQPGYIQSRKKHSATYFKCYKWIKVSKPTRGCSFWLRWRNKSL